MIAAAVGGYAIGALPLGYLAGRRWGGVDLRQVGSGNVGATNMYRTKGLRLGLLVMALDAAKGALAVALAARAAPGDVDPVVAGVAAIVGHVYPVWLRGHGGRGVATACGVFSQLAPMATLAAALMFVVTVWLTRIVSAGSVAATLTLPWVAWATGLAPAVVWGSAGVAMLILWRHRGNLARMRQGRERRIATPEAPHA